MDATRVRKARPIPKNEAKNVYVIIISLFVLLIILVTLSSETNEEVEKKKLYADLRERAKDRSLKNEIEDEILAQKKQLYAGIPYRVRELLLKNEIVGEHIGEIKSGSLTVEEAIHGHKHHSDVVDKAPMTITEIVAYLDSFIQALHTSNEKVKKMGEKMPEIGKRRDTHAIVWKAYHDLVVKTLYPWDQEYIQRMPPRRKDDSIFLAVASYRDENCLQTLTQAYKNARYPEKLFVGLVQQNCEKDCVSGVLDADGKVENVDPDEDCFVKFCESKLGRPHCAEERVRFFSIPETEALGPYAARYFGSKLWHGEQWYMQIDSHMSFAKEWDSKSIQMLQKAPSEKPVISHYPPPDGFDFEKEKNTPPMRICGAEFATSEIESQILRLSDCFNYDVKKLDIPRFAPFIAAGYFVTNSDFLRDVPYDPFLPYIFMGEEIIMSARLWTSGYDIFSPSDTIVSHVYVREHQPKFWEIIRRVFGSGVHNPLQSLILERVKYLVGYPEAARDEIREKSILTAVEQYGLGNVRSLVEYLDMAGLDMGRKETVPTGWCHKGVPPKGFEKHASLYT